MDHVEIRHPLHDEGVFRVLRGRGVQEDQRLRFILLCGEEILPLVTGKDIDGADEKLGGSIGAGGGLLLALGGAASAVAPLACLVSAASLGFLLWNWPPAKIFMGDPTPGWQCRVGLTRALDSIFTP